MRAVFELIKRHRILTAFSLFCVILIIIGWSVRPDLDASPSAEPDIEPSSSETTTLMSQLGVAA